MMVIPRQQEVTLIYERTNSDIIGLVLTLVGWGFVLIVLILNLIRTLSSHKRNKYLGYLKGKAGEDPDQIIETLRGR
jgi:hypothetical protein